MSGDTGGPTHRRSLTVAGAGVLGLWQALVLAKRGHDVRLIDRSPDPLATSASSYAGAMLAPYCEAEAAPRVVLEQGIEALRLWRETYPGVVAAGTLVVAAQRDQSELERFARDTEGARRVSSSDVRALEPDLAGRFAGALFYADEAHVATPEALEFLCEEVRRAGVSVQFGTELAPRDCSGTVVDCRGMGANGESGGLRGLRGVRGERVVLKTADVTLSRPIRLLHPRHPIYVVPWGEGRFMVGATVIESEDTSGVSARSMLDLLGAAYAVHPAFLEAEIIDAGAGLRPALDDNVPRVIVSADAERVSVNGAYRHGFLLAPVLAELTADILDGRGQGHPLLRDLRQ